jgi:threonine aldolase
MTRIFHVSPFDGGWCVKICDTGEVLFFETGGQAERQALALAAACSGTAEVRVHDRQARLVGRWVDGARLIQAFKVDEPSDKGSIVSPAVS